MYLHLDELKKVGIEECIRKKFIGLWYDGEIVSINLNTKFYHIRYTDKDKEDMTVADVRRYWVVKVVNKNKSGRKKDKQRNKNV